MTVGAADQDQRGGDRDVDRGAGNGDQELFAWLFRDTLEPRDAADRKQDHVRRHHAESARGKYVTKLMKQYAQE